MSQIVRLATCSLSQWALDFEGNYQRIVESIVIAKNQGAKYRLGPELEVTGYVCYDHFYESDLYEFSWQVVLQLLENPECSDIICDIGLPIQYKGVLYNCRLIFLNGKIVLIRPKLYLANDGNYRETRWFTPWTRHRQVESFKLPKFVAESIQQEQVPFGDGVIETRETCLGTELCEELYVPDSPHIHMGLDGIEIFTNGSASHHTLRKLQVGGAYLYSNLQGCDGSNLYFDGSSLIAVNGNIIAKGTQFSLQDVEVVVANIDLDEIRSYRGANRGIGTQSSAAPTSYPRIRVDFSLSVSNGSNYSDPLPNGTLFHSPEEEIELGPACWLWDYLRRSGARGFLIPLSGGLDSLAVSLIVFSMCNLVSKAIRNNENRGKVLPDVLTILGLENNKENVDKISSTLTPTILCNHILHTVYMGTENSSGETRGRAKKLSEVIGSYHLQFSFDSVISAVLSMVKLALGGMVPKFSSSGGSKAENLALQNIQARLRMVFAYLFAQLLPWARGKNGNLLVLGSSNVDECIRGYFTKYDCSSADLNPIGAISKNDLRRFVFHFKEKYQIPLLEEFLKAKPTAELEPITSSYQQNDEDDMGFTYNELETLGYLRKVHRHGPLSMFKKLEKLWTNYTPANLETKINSFFYYNALNRHKMTVLTPAYHAEAYSVDDHRFDMRPFLYPLDFTLQKKCLNKYIAQSRMEKS